jgi:hypothetical protein
VGVCLFGMVGIRKVLYRGRRNKMPFSVGDNYNCFKVFFILARCSSVNIIY